MLGPRLGLVASLFLNPRKRDGQLEATFRKGGWNTLRVPFSVSVGGAAVGVPLLMFSKGAVLDFSTNC